MLLTGKKVLIMGIRNKWSIAWGAAKSAYENGAEVLFTCSNMENIEKYLEMTKAYPNLGLGVHLNITVGKPLTKVSFIDEKGNFKSRDTYKNREAIVLQEELYQEWKAQIEKFIKKVAF